MEAVEHIAIVEIFLGEVDCKKVESLHAVDELGLVFFVDSFEAEHFADDFGEEGAVGVLLCLFFAEFGGEPVVEFLQLPVPLEQAAHDVFVVGVVASKRGRVVVGAVDQQYLAAGDVPEQSEVSYVEIEFGNDVEDALFEGFLEVDFVVEVHLQVLVDHDLQVVEQRLQSALQPFGLFADPLHCGLLVMAVHVLLGAEEVVEGSGHLFEGFFEHEDEGFGSDDICGSKFLYSGDHWEF